MVYCLFHCRYDEDGVSVITAVVDIFKTIEDAEAESIRRNLKRSKFSNAWYEVEPFTLR